MPRFTRTGKPVETETFRRKFSENVTSTLDTVRPCDRDDVRDLLWLIGSFVLIALPLVLAAKNEDDGYLIVAEPLLGCLLILAIVPVVVVLVAAVGTVLLLTSSLFAAIGAVVGPVRQRCARVRLARKKLRAVRKGRLTLENTPSLRAAIDDAFYEVDRAPARQGPIERLLLKRLIERAEHCRTELFAWLDSEESFRQAVRLLRQTDDSAAAVAPLGPVDTVWVYNRPTGSEASLRLVREFLPGKATPQGMGVVCTPREVYQLLLDADRYGSQPAGRYRNSLMRTTPRIGRESAMLDGADPETVAKLYDPNEDALYSDLNELVAAAKLL